MTSTAGTSGTNSNASLAFTAGGSSFYFATRCNKITHGYEAVASESHARTTRAFYPRNRALSQFTLSMQLKGYKDYKAFMDFMRAYVQNFTSTATNAMSVSVPQRNFMRYGVPVGGISDGDHVGSMLFAPTIAFESIYDPLDTTIFTTTHDASQVDLGTSQSDEAATFFYPVTASTNDPNATGESLYDAPPIIVTPAPIGPAVGIPPTSIGGGRITAN